MKTDVCVVVGVYVYHNMNFLSHWAYSEETRGEERRGERRGEDASTHMVRKHHIMQARTKQQVKAGVS